MPTSTNSPAALEGSAMVSEGESPEGPLAFRRWLSGADTHLEETGRPLVGLCYAQSLDGCIAAQCGQPTALSGAESSRLTHQLRAAHAAILVGVGTVLADNPQLTVRHAPGENPQPVVLDSRLRTPPGSRLVSGHPRPAWIATSEHTPAAEAADLEAAGARVLRLPEDGSGRVSLPALLERLGQLGVSSLMVEGGAQVITAFLSQRLADWVCITVAPRFLGGLPAVAGAPGLPATLNEVSHQSLGSDLIVWGRLAK